MRRASVESAGLVRSADTANEEPRIGDGRIRGYRRRLDDRVAADARHAGGARRAVPARPAAKPVLTRRVFSDEEAHRAERRQPFKQPVEQGYPVLARAAAAPGREEFLDGTAAFDGETAAVYEDDCCHYTDRGYEILAELIASR